MRNFDGLQRFLTLFITATGIMVLSGSGLHARQPEALKTVVVIGTGTIYKGNSAAARQAAIKNGLNVALDAAVVELLSPESLVGHFQIINQVIQEQTADFIQGYKVLGEYQAGNAYRAVVEATISIEAISKKLADVSISIGAKELPKVLFFISEQNPAGALAHYWWGGDAQYHMSSAEKSMGRVLTEKGFQVADPRRSVAGTKNRTIDFPEAIDTASAMLLAANYGAKVIVMGSAVSRPAPNTMGTSRRSYAASVKTRAFMVADGTELALVEKEAVVAGSDDVVGGREAIEEAADMAAAALAERVVAVWGKEGKTLTTIKIAVEGTRDLANFVMFRRVIKKMPDVEKIKTLEMRPDQAVIEVDYQGTAETFANGLMVNPFEHFRLDIYEVSGELLRVALIPQ
ncbi:MAG: hypothetical protein GY697_10730 [Desulfobacterales bacterium]|nr:hypothetical protein [Desulfobacterales bacterium]